MIKKKTISIMIASMVGISSIICLSNEFTSISFAKVGNINKAIKPVKKPIKPIKKSVKSVKKPVVKPAINVNTTKTDLKEPLKIIYIWDKNNDINSATDKVFSKSIKTEQDTLQFLATLKEKYNIKVGDFNIVNVDKDKFGKKHYKTILTVKGIPVYGSELLVHVDAEDRIYNVNGKVSIDIPNVDWQSKFKVKKEEAIKFAYKDLEFKVDDKTFIEKPTTETYLYQFKGKMYPIYLVDLKCASTKPLNMKVFINAENGEIVDKYNASFYN